MQTQRQAKNATVQVRMTTKTKRAAEKVFNRLGITPTIAVTLFYNQVGKVGGIPFAPGLDGTIDLSPMTGNELALASQDALARGWDTPAENKRWAFLQDASAAKS